jgi:murein DD-endopeptidase MepM/ murein hydrolase activator NlpD
VKKIIALLAVAVIGMLAWIAAAPQSDDRSSESAPVAQTEAIGGSPSIEDPPAPAPAPVTTPSPATESTPEPVVPPDVIAPIATATTPPPVIETTTETVPSISDPDAPRPMIVPVASVARSAMRDMFNEVRGNRRHEAIDILAPRGTPVIAADDGVVKKLFTSKPGGLTVYEFDPDQRFCYYYAHLDRYADGLHEGQTLRRGEILGYVGTTGNAPKDTPHLHFALIRLNADRHWWQGTYVNPYPLLAGK